MNNDIKTRLEELEKDQQQTLEQINFVTTGTEKYDKLMEHLNEVENEIEELKSGKHTAGVKQSILSESEYIKNVDEEPSEQRTEKQNIIRISGEKSIDRRKNGHGVVQYQDGNRYDGMFKDGKRHGQGKFTWKNGNVYEGEFENDQMSGHGKFTGVNGVIFEGEYKNGYPNGRGKEIYNGDVYECEYVNGRKNGHGIAKYANGDSFEGMFKNGYRGNLRGRFSAQSCRKAFLCQRRVFWFYSKRETA